MGESNSQMSHSVKDQADDDERGRPPFFIRLKSPPRKENKLAKISAEKGTEETRNSLGTSTSSNPLKNDGSEAKNTGHTGTSYESLKNSCSEPNSIGTKKNVESGTTSDRKYIMWENSFNLCWLDASMALLAHNQILHLQMDSKSNCQISTILKCYNEANVEINSVSFKNLEDLSTKTAREILKVAQDRSLSYLQPRMKCKEGEPDSAFCSLYNLMVENKTVRSLFDVEFLWQKDCQKCKIRRSIKYKKPIITLAKVNTFRPDIPVSICQCPACKEPDQKMTLFYKKLPACLTFHFENGAGCGDLQCLDFEVNSRKYELTGVMILEKIQEYQVSHFITWIRDPATNSWLECNDLNTGVKSFSPETPAIKLEDVYIITFEAVDKLGIVTETSDTVPCSPVKCNEGSETRNDEIPFIDLSDETDEKSQNKDSNLNKCNMDGQNSELCSVKKDFGHLTTTSQDAAVSDPDLLELYHTEPKAESTELASVSKPCLSSNNLQTDGTVIKDNSLSPEKQIINESNSVRSNKTATKDNTAKFCNNQEVRISSHFERDIPKSDTLTNKETGAVNETVVDRNIDPTDAKVTQKKLRSGVIKLKVTLKKDSGTKSPLRIKDELVKRSSDAKSSLKIKGNEIDKLSSDNVYQKEKSENGSVNILADNKGKVRKHVKETVEEGIISGENDKQLKGCKIASKNFRNMTEKQDNEPENQLGEDTKAVKSHQISDNGVLGKRKFAEETEADNACHVIDECNSGKAKSSETETIQINQRNNHKIVSLEETLKTPVKSNVCGNSKQMSSVEPNSAKKVGKMRELSHSDLEKIESQTDIHVSPRRKVTPKKQCCEITISPQNLSKETDLCNKRKQNVNEDLANAVPRYSTRKSVQPREQSCCEESVVDSKPEQITRKANTHDDAFSFLEKRSKKSKTGAENSDAGSSSAEKHKATVSEDPSERKKISRSRIPFNTKTRSMKGASTTPKSVLDSIKQLGNYDTDKTCEPIAGATQKESKRGKLAKPNSKKSSKVKNKKDKAPVAKRRKIRDMLPKEEKPSNTSQLANPGNGILTFIKKIQDSELRKRAENNLALSQNGADSVMEFRVDNSLTSAVNDQLTSAVGNSGGNQLNHDIENLTNTANQSLLLSDFCGVENCRCTNKGKDESIDDVVDYMSTFLFEFFVMK